MSAPNELDAGLDAVVVGAGISGLAAARRLRLAGAKVAVVEARDRVGGRTLSVPLGRDVIDLGGQWIGPSQRRVHRLAEELGIGSFPQHCQGDKLLSVGGKLGRYAGTIPRLGPLDLVEAEWMIRRLDGMQEAIPPRAPWEAKEAARWDGLSVEAYKRRAVRTEGARALLDLAVRAIFAAEPEELSFLFFLSYLRAGGGLLRMGRVEDGGQERRLIGGAQQLSLRMAAALEGDEGASLIFEAPVRAIEQTEQGVLVRSDRGPLRARRAILAIPPTLAGDIDFSPALPTLRDQLLQRMPMGSAIKCVVAYERAFWRDAGLSGEALSHEGPLTLVLDDTSHDGAQPALVAFFLGQGARAHAEMSQEERRAIVLSQLGRLFGEEATRPSAYLDHNWLGEAWSRGCYTGLMAPGTVSTCARALREPSGRLHWAGTETATQWTGYFDGAIEAGERAAAEVIALL